MSKVTQATRIPLPIPNGYIAVRQLSPVRYRELLEFMDSRMAFLMERDGYAYEAARQTYEECRIRFELPVPKIIHYS